MATGDYLETEKRMQEARKDDTPIADIDFLKTEKRMQVARKGHPHKAHTSTFKVRFKRRREGKTNYAKRLALLSSNLPRLVARKTNRYIIAQLIEYSPSGDRTMVHVSSGQLRKFGWNASKKNLPAAYLTGLIAGLRAKQQKADKAILDIGFSTPIHGSFWSAVLKGAIDAGLQIKAGETAMPKQERIEGKHIEQFAAKLDEKRYSEIFSGYAKEKIDAKQLSRLFNAAKEKILAAKGGENQK